MYLFSLSNDEKYTKSDKHQLIRLTFHNWQINSQNNPINEKFTNERISHDFWDSKNCNEVNLLNLIIYDICYCYY